MSIIDAAIAALVRTIAALLRYSVGERIHDRSTGDLFTFQKSLDVARDAVQTKLSKVVYEVARRWKRPLLYHYSVPAPRHLNAWTDDDAPQSHQSFHIFVNIGELRGSAAKSVLFPEMDWGNKAAIGLLVALSAPDCTIDPPWGKLLLPRFGNSNILDFTIVASKGGKLTFSISVYLEKQMIRVQVVTFEVFIRSIDPARIGALA